MSSSSKIIKSLINFLLIDKQDIRYIVFYGLTAGLFSLILPLGAQFLFTNIAYKTALQPLVIITIIVLFALFFSAGLMSLQTYLVEIIQRRIYCRTSLSIAKFIPQTKFEEFKKINGAELLNRFFEILHVQKMQSLILMDGLGIFLQTVIGLCLLAFYHPYLLAYDIILIICLYLIIWKLGTDGIATSIKESKEKYNMAGWLEEIAKNKPGFSSELSSQFVLKKSDLHVSRYLHARHQHFRILFRQYIATYGLFAFSSAFLLLLGGWMVIKGELTVGQLVAAELVVSAIAINFTKIGKYIESGYDLVTSFDKLSQIFNISREYQNGFTNCPDKIDKLSLENISYTYQNSEVAIGPLNFEFKKGKLYGLYAAKGVGKTTIAEIIAILRTPNSGKIKINNLDLLNFNTTNLRNKICLISEPQIFTGTILENLTLSLDKNFPPELEKILHHFDFKSELNSLEKALHTEITNPDGQLSKQTCLLITLFRSLYQNPEVLILDQIHEQLDGKNQEKLMDYLNKISNETIVIVLSANKNFLKDQGELIELM